MQDFSAKVAKEAPRTQSDIERIGRSIVDAAFKVHSKLGPGLLESTYELCLAHEIRKAGLSARQQVLIPIRYDDLTVENGYRIDLIVENLVVVELKAVEAIQRVHRGSGAQLSTLGKIQAGLSYQLQCRAHARRHHATRQRPLIFGANRFSAKVAKDARSTRR